MLDRHEDEHDSLDELLTDKWDDTHVEKDSRKDWKRHKLDKRGQENWAADGDMSKNVGQSLFSKIPL